MKTFSGKSIDLCFLGSVTMKVSTYRLRILTACSDLLIELRKSEAVEFAKGIWVAFDTRRVESVTLN